MSCIARMPFKRLRKCSIAPGTLMLARRGRGIVATSALDKLEITAESYASRGRRSEARAAQCAGLRDEGERLTGNSGGG